MAINQDNIQEYMESITNIAEATRIYETFMLKMLGKYIPDAPIKTAIDQFKLENGTRARIYINTIDYLIETQGQDLVMTLIALMNLSGYIKEQTPLLTQLAQTVEPELTEQADKNRFQFLKNDHQECLDGFNACKAAVLAACIDEQSPKPPRRSR